MSIFVVIILLYCPKELNVVGMGMGLCSSTKQDLKGSRFEVGVLKVKGELTFKIH